MKKELIEMLLDIAVAHGASFAEVYYEKKNDRTFYLSDKIIENIGYEITRGVGFRVANGEEVYYASTNDLRKNNLMKIMNMLVEPINKRPILKRVKLRKKKSYFNIVEKPHSNMTMKEKISVLKEIDTTVRNKSDLVSQVSATIGEKTRYELIANTDGVYVENTSVYTRLSSGTIVTRDGVSESCGDSKTLLGGYEVLEHFDYIENALHCLDVAIRKLDAEYFEGGEVPVVIANGFGGIIFHEACVHGFEATSVAPGLSIFKDKLGEKIASDKVTIIDDATIPLLNGTNLIDNEGNVAKRNVLVENGVLKSFLVDNLNAKKMNCASTSSGRRESYRYAPTSRMNNTYLEKGKDKFSDMIESIKLGVYCKMLSGGSVDTSTGNFNFAVSEAYLIENGKIGKMIKGITLIGNGKDILNEVEMVGDDLEHSDGWCGSKSGTVLVTVGQPTIKVSKILVGGKR